MEPKPSIVISGSFRKHFAGISEIAAAFKELEIEVLSPKISKVINPGDEFALLESDDTHDPKVLEQRHLEAISRADALYVFDPEGYVGASATLEVGWALALGKPIFCKEPAKDFTLGLYVAQVASPKEIRAAIVERRKDPLAMLTPDSSVRAIQEVSRQLCVQRGFADEKPLEIMLLMVEEVGELAKALRKASGLKTDQASAEKISRVETEVADIFIYLLHLANACGLDLHQAMVKKEAENNKRTWG